MLSIDEKKAIISKYAINDKDTGSAEVQIALLTSNIVKLQDHFKEHKKDQHSRRGLIRMVNQRRKLLDYLIKTDSNRYKKIVADLGLRR